MIKSVIFFTPIVPSHINPCRKGLHVGQSSRSRIMGCAWLPRVSYGFYTWQLRGLRDVHVRGSISVSAGTVLRECVHSKNCGVKITPPVLIEDHTMHFIPVLNLRC